MVDTSSDRRHACNRLNTDRRRTSTMSPKRTTAPPPIKHSRSSSSGRKWLIAKEKTEKQSARKRSALDNRFHRTVVLIPARIAILPERRKERHALDAVLQLAGDFLGTGNEVVDLEEALLFRDVELEGHDQRVCQRFQSGRLDLRHPFLFRKKAEVLLRELGEPCALRVGLGRVALDLRPGSDPHGAVRLARHLVDDAEARLTEKDEVVAAVVERHRVLDPRHGAARVHGRRTEVV